MAWQINGNLKTVLASAGLLLTIGAGWATLKSESAETARRVISIERTIEERSNNPQSTAVGAALQQQITDINRRLDRIEAKQDEMLRLLSRPR